VAVAMALLRGALKALKRDGGAAELRAVGPAWLPGRAQAGGNASANAAHTWFRDG
jgi:hypothetical protein